MRSFAPADILTAHDIVTTHHVSESTEPHTGFADETLGLAVEPLPGAVEELRRSIDVDTAARAI